jgi:protein-L-isoaspartate(D-aspartate) O-methyltransferase
MPKTTHKTHEPIAQRDRMVKEQLVRRGIASPAVLRAMREVPREAFVPEPERTKAWDDCALPLAHGQTISQPYMVARSVELAQLGPDDHVLEVGLGSGYQAAVMSRLCASVIGVEIIEPLAHRAEETLRELGYDNVRVRVADGSVGLPEHAPYDCIMVAAGAPHVPEQLVEQLAPGGRLIIPVGSGVQTLTVITRTPEGPITREYDQCMYVPLRGAAGSSSV